MEKHNQKVPGINNRIKTEQSLKEKIIRKKVYKNTNSPEEILNKIQDIIGILIECQFIKDEKVIFEIIKKEFCVYMGDGHYSCPSNSRIYLNLRDKQPHHLKNETKVYKIDGFYKQGQKKYKFELQIKSLVQVFWSEVEHQMVYKNNFYIPDDIYVRETLSAIRNNLLGLDKMLELINTYTSTLNNSNVIESFELSERLLKKLIVETFNDKIMGSIRIKIDIKNTRDLVTNYILYDYSKISPENKKRYFYNIIDTFKEVKDKQILFKHDDYPNVEFDNDEFEESKKYLLKMSIKDFEWDLYLFILTHLYPNKDIKQIIDETIEMFVTYFDDKIKHLDSKNDFLISLFSMGILCKTKYEEIKLT